VENVPVGLADAIEALRDELIDAMSRGADKPMRFSLAPIELTVQVVVTKDAHGKIGWQVLEFGGSVEKARTQMLTVKLSPLWKKGDGTLTADFAVASVGPSGDTFGSHD
jgi:Trypsin-co-occurring domain 2